ncbi:MAG: hypothetical protein ACRDTH_12990 [Pseudonocardiaceae bacterium]
MSTTLATQRGSDPAASTTPMARMDAALHLSSRTTAWLADHPAADQFVTSVWDKLAELERSGQYPGAIDALRRVLTKHQPTAGGRCRTCRRVTGRRRPFPCIVWHQIRCDLLGLFAGAGRHRPGPAMTAATPSRPAPVTPSVPTTSGLPTGGGGVCGA